MFELDVDVRVNTVNCVGVMGAGVARAFKKKYPQMFLEYRNACEAGDIRPGKLHIWHSPTGEWVINFPTKRHWREKARYEDIHAGLISLRDYLKDRSGVKIALPALGCGNGGLDWSRVAPMISEQLHDLEAEIFVFEPADSLRLGKALRDYSADHARELDELGFRPYDLPAEIMTHGELRVLMKGNPELLNNRWISLWMSREVGAREFSALESIATQMSLLPQPPTVALIYESTASEEVAELFLRTGLAVVILLPFSKLVMKRIALSNNSAHRVTFVILSLGAPKEKTSAPLDRATRDLLHRGASAILVSDPDPQRHLGEIVKLSGRRPSFFVRYSTHSSDVVYRLEHEGFRAIGRRPDTGEPNLSPLVEEQVDPSESGLEEPASAQVSALVTSAQLRSLANIVDKLQSSPREIHLSFNFSSLPIEAQQAMREILLGEGIDSASTD